MDVKLLCEAIRDSWGADTSYFTDWHESSPSYGQCAVTALVVQDYLGGNIMKKKVNGGSHYLNELPDGTLLDPTMSQYLLVMVETSPEIRERSRLISSNGLIARYAILSERVRRRLPP